MELKMHSIDIPENTNVIFGQSHFIKTVEDIFEALSDSSMGIQFGLAFCEASGPCLIRKAGNNTELIKIAISEAEKIGAGHTFIIYLKNAFPINVLPRLRQIPEIVAIFCATANPVQVILAESDQGRGVMGVIDGFSPKGVENEEQTNQRREFLRKIQYKE